MRQLKFRAWDGTKMQEAFDLTSNPKYWWEQNKDYYLMQYTGLKDINDVEIYEGDIVKETVKLIRGKKKETFYVVSFGNGMFQYKQPLAYGHEHLEVVGNIKESPELLEE